MKIRLMLLFILATCTANAQVEYEGTGILKVYQDDKVLIIPDSAYLITQEMYEWGLDVHQRLKYSSSEKVIAAQKSELERVKKSRSKQSFLYQECLLTQRYLIEDYQNTIDSVQIELDKAASTIEEIELVSKRKSELLASQRKKTKRRTFMFSVPMVALLAKIGIDYFTP